MKRMSGQKREGEGKGASTAKQGIYLKRATRIHIGWWIGIGRMNVKSGKN